MESQSEHLGEGFSAPLTFAQQKHTVSSTSPPWTMIHGFYAGMGGFVVEMDNAFVCDGKQFLPSKIDRVVLTAKGVDLLARCGLLPELSAEEIQDKSKTDWLAKALAILQGCWMLFQVIARLALDLPVTLLEVMTVAHVLCAFVVYMMWWNKPRWVTEPTRLDEPWVRPIVAFMFICSQLSTQEREKTGILRDLGPQSEIATLVYVPPRDDASNSVKQVVVHEYVQDASNTGEEFGGEFLFRKQRTKSCTPNELEGQAQRTDEYELDDVTLERQRLALAAIHKYPPIRALLKRPLRRASTKYENAIRQYPDMPHRFRENITRVTSNEPVTGLEFDGEQFLTLSADNWPNEDLFRQTKGLFMGSIMWVATIGFSAVHIAAWNAFFPSSVEAWFWRASSLFIGASGAIWFLIHVLANISEAVWWFWYNAMIGQVSRFSYIALGVPSAVCGIVYCVARIFLVVEAFISLRWLPASAFASPSWLLTVPHLN